jgi:hypothetical protein
MQLCRVETRSSDSKDAWVSGSCRVVTRTGLSPDANDIGGRSEQCYKIGMARRETDADI